MRQIWLDFILPLSFSIEVVNQKYYTLKWKFQLLTILRYTLPASTSLSSFTLDSIFRVHCLPLFLPRGFMCAVILVNSVSERGSRIWQNLYFEISRREYLQWWWNHRNLDERRKWRSTIHLHRSISLHAACVWSRRALRLDGILATLDGARGGGSLDVP